MTALVVATLLSCTGVASATALEAESLKFQRAELVNKANVSLARAKLLLARSHRQMKEIEERTAYYKELRKSLEAHKAAEKAYGDRRRVDD